MVNDAKLASSNLTLPDFGNPPVVETSLGFVFSSAIPNWSTKHYWLFWDRIRTRYPDPTIQLPIGEFEIKVGSGQVPLRVWYLNSSHSELLQVQSNLFLRNWRKTTQSHLYQHYAEVSPGFKADWGTFLQFLDGQSLPRPQIDRCEMTYFNHLVRGEDWEDFSELPALYPAWRGSSEYPLSDPKTINIAASYAIANGMLQINSQGAVRQSDGKEIIQLTVTATRVPEGQLDSNLFGCLDYCHESAAMGFLSFTGERMHEKWGRIR